MHTSDQDQSYFLTSTNKLVTLFFEFPVVVEAMSLVKLSTITFIQSQYVFWYLRQALPEPIHRIGGVKDATGLPCKNW